MSLWGLPKRLLFGRGPRPHKIWFGPGAGRTFIIDPASKSQRILGLDEAEIAGLFAAQAVLARTVIDVGASDGYYTILALCLNPSATAIGCEPLDAHRQHALDNYRLNVPGGGTRFEWVTQLVGGEAGQATLDQLVAHRDGPLLVKIDVDGAEIDVLRSGERVLARRDCRLLIEVHSPALETGVIDVLTSHRYTCRIIDNAWWRAIVPERRPGELNRWVFAEPADAAQPAAG
jgi:hypothetical protein